MRNLTESELDFVSGAITIPDFRHDGHDYTQIVKRQSISICSIAPSRIQAFPFI